MKFPWLFLIPILLSCSNGGGDSGERGSESEVDSSLLAETKEEAPISEHAYNPPTDFQVFCFYKLDGKNESLELEMDINEWMGMKEAEIDSGYAGHDLFQGKWGGGPHGAQWNPSADLYFYFHIPEEDEGQELSMYMNLDELPPLSAGTNWVNIPEDSWLARLRPIEQKDIELLFDEDYLKALEEMEGGELEAKDIPGEVVRLDFRLGDQTITHYLHAAFGE